MSDIAEQLSNLAHFFGRKLNDAQTRRYLQVLSINGDLTAELMDRLIYGEEHFPSLAKINRMILELKNERWQRTKANEAQHNLESLATAVKADPEHAKESFKLLHAITNGRLRGQAIIEEMRRMETRFPDYGWRRAAANLDRWRNKRR